MAGRKLIKLSERAVDFAWREVRNNASEKSETLDQRASNEILNVDEENPIIKVEKSARELEAFLRLKQTDDGDKETKLAYMKRVQLLVTCLGAMTQYLVDENETQDEEKSQMLENLTRSRTVGASFRKANKKAAEEKSKVKEELKKSMNNSMVDVSVNKSLAKLKVIKNGEL